MTTRVRLLAFWLGRAPRSVTLDYCRAGCDSPWRTIIFDLVSSRRAAREW